LLIVVVPLDWSGNVYLIASRLLILIEVLILRGWLLDGEVCLRSFILIEELDNWFFVESSELFCVFWSGFQLAFRNWFKSHSAVGFISFSSNSFVNLLVECFNCFDYIFSLDLLDLFRNINSSVNFFLDNSIK